MKETWGDDWTQVLLLTLGSEFEYGHERDCGLWRVSGGG